MSLPRKGKTARHGVRERRGKLVLIIGPSGVGKSAILQALRERRPEWHFPRSATTRPRREGEGDDLYRFVTDAEFDALIRGGKLLEWAIVHGGPPERPDGRAGARYGTLIEEIIPFIESGRTVVREVDVQGFNAIRGHRLFRGGGARGSAPATAPNALQSIFILPDNEEQLVRRITMRAPISGGELRRRMASIGKEMAYAPLCDGTVRNAEGKLADTVSEAERLIVG